MIKTDEINSLLQPTTPEEDEALRESIRQHGKCLYPIIVDELGEIIEGHRRKRACDELGIDCPTTVIGKLSSSEKRKLTLELNLCRRMVGLDSKRKIARILLRRTPELSDRSIGAQAGLDHKTVGALRVELGVAGEIPQLPTRTGRDGKAYPSITVHRAGDVERALRAMQGLGDIAPGKPMELRCAERKVRERQMALDRSKEIALPTSEDAIQILHSDFRKLNVRENSVGLMFTDPPYPKAFLHLWDELGAFAARVLRPGGLLLTYLGHIYLDHVMAALGRHLRYVWQFVLLHHGTRTPVPCAFKDAEGLLFVPGPK